MLPRLTLGFWCCCSLLALSEADVAVLEHMLALRRLYVSPSFVAPTPARLQSVAALKTALPELVIIEGVLDEASTVHDF